MQDTRVTAKPEFLDSQDSVGPYFTLNPSRASRFWMMMMMTIIMRMILTRFWMPDVFIDQAKALRSPTYYTKPASLRVYNDSTIRYSSRSEMNYHITLLILYTLTLHLLPSLYARSSIIYI